MKDQSKLNHIHAKSVKFSRFDQNIAKGGEGKKVMIFLIRGRILFEEGENDKNHDVPNRPIVK